MYPTARRLANLARLRQQDLIAEAAAAHLIRRASEAPSVPSPAPRSLRSRLATGLRVLAAWVDGGAQVETPRPLLNAA